jgi:hypothetical protein
MKSFFVAQRTCVESAWNDSDVKLTTYLVIYAIWHGMTRPSHEPV